MALELALDAEAEEWLAHPVAGAAVRSALEGTPWHDMLFDEHNGQMMRAIPLLRLSRFPGFPIAETDLPELLAAANA